MKLAVTLCVDFFLGHAVLCGKKYVCDTGDEAIMNIAQENPNWCTRIGTFAAVTFRELLI